MKALFSSITSLSLRFRLITLLLVVLASIAGVVAVTELRQELIPPIELPQTIILAQASGMTSEQVLTTVTERMEDALDSIPEIVNLESTTTGSFGAVITARNDFGLNQERIRANIQAAIDSTWLPLRRISAPEGEDPTTFAARLLDEMTADVLIYLQERDSNFLFQLSPAVWEALSPDTVTQVAGYLAAENQSTAGDASALRRLIDQEIIPALETLPQLGTISVSGGQALPDDASAVTETPAVTSEPESLLLQLSSEVWEVVSARTGQSGTLDQNAVDALSASSVTIPEEAPALPPSWQIDRFKDASDLREMRSLTRSIASVFNNFLETGRIEGSLGQTDDLTPEIIERMLEIEPTLVEYFKAEQLVAMSDDVFAALPESFIAELDGFTRDELAAKAVAQMITGEQAAPEPADLPQAWRIAPPQLITFGFDDLPLATFSISGSSEIAAGEPTSTPDSAAGETLAEVAAQDQPAASETPTPSGDIPEGPALPLIFNLIGIQFGIELNSADDLINLQLPEEAASQFGMSSLMASDLFNFMLLLQNPDSLPGDVQVTIPIDVATILGTISPEAIAFIAENDPTFVPNLSAEVFDTFSDDVLALPQIAPPLDQAWNTLGGQPQFAGQPLVNTRDILDLGDGQASAVLNSINESVPERFAGYEVRLFDSLSTGALRYFALHEPDFYANLDPAVIEKLSAAALAQLPEDVLAGLDPALAERLTAIASGEQPTAADAQSALYTSDVPEADPNAPAINTDWQLVGDFIGVELNSADDFFRFFPSVSGFFNELFDSAQGIAFAPSLFGNLPVDAAAYMDERDPDLFNNLRIEALQLLTPEVLTALPQSVQDRTSSGAQPFVPTSAVTRTNGSSSMMLTIYKSSDANTVEAYHLTEQLLHEIDEANDDISVGIAFEQASFIEESISGVAREGGLGAVFAVVVILVFLSGGLWSLRGRRVTGIVIAVVFAAALVGIVLINANASGVDFATAFAQTDMVLLVLLIGATVIGVLVAIWPRPVPYPAWRSTLVTAVSIPLSVLMALAFMHWIPPAIHELLAPYADGSPLIMFILRLFPSSISLNILTLSGLTVAIGRVVDDSIVVLENIFRQIQAGGDKRAAIISGTRDVSVAIFAATVITVVVFLPLGLTGGIIGEFFLPFGLAVTYSLMASFVVAITVVPVLAYMLLDRKDMTEAENTILERIYLPVLRWALDRGRNMLIVLAIAAISLVIGGLLLAGRPQAFLPELGEPQITVEISLPVGTKITETNARAAELEAYLRDEFGDQVKVVQTVIGSAGLDLSTLLLGESSVSENIGQMTIGVTDPEQIDAFTQEVRARAEQIFGAGNSTVSAASLTEQGLGGFALVLSGPRDALEAIDQQIIATLNDVPGLANVGSNLAGFAEGGSEGAQTFIRVDKQSAVRYTGELETSDTLGVTNAAKQAILDLPGLPETITVSEGFETALQTEGFANLFVAMGIAIVIVIILLMITFNSLVHWLDIILSIVVAPVGAAVLLALTDRVLGISAMIGLLMLIGIVVTNAVVLIDRVQSNRYERGMSVHDALIEAGGRRLRPIVMTALATIMALLPLAIGLSKGAIIASELGTVVIGGLFSSTLLTLIVVPVAYMLLSPLHKRIAGLVKRG